MDYSKQFSASVNRLSDRDMLLDLLITEKHLSNLYDQGMLEATSPLIANTLERLQADTHDNARTIFNAMQQRGWYNAERTAKSERAPKEKQKQASELFDTTADSRFAVLSGTRKFGRHLASGQRSSKNGVYNHHKTDVHNREWQ